MGNIGTSDDEHEFGSVPKLCSHRRQTVGFCGLVTAATSILDFRDRAKKGSSAVDRFTQTLSLVTILPHSIGTVIAGGDIDSVSADPVVAVPVENERTGFTGDSPPADNLDFDWLGALAFDLVHYDALPSNEKKAPPKF